MNKTLTNIDGKKKWTAKYVEVSLPERREIKPIGRATLLGKELSLEQTKNFIKVYQNK